MKITFNIERLSLTVEIDDPPIPVAVEETIEEEQIEDEPTKDSRAHVETKSEPIETTATEPPPQPTLVPDPEPAKKPPGKRAALAEECKVEIARLTREQVADARRIANEEEYPSGGWGESRLSAFLTELKRSGSQSTARHYGKTTTVDDLLKAIKAKEEGLNEMGIAELRMDLDLPAADADLGNVKTEALTAYLKRLGD